MGVSETTVSWNRKDNNKRLLNLHLICLFWLWFWYFRVIPRPSRIPVVLLNQAFNNGNMDSRVSTELVWVFECLNAPLSRVDCSFVKALYCISFLSQSPFPVAVPCQTTMTRRFLRVACRQVCHEPWGFTASHWTTSRTAHLHHNHYRPHSVWVGFSALTLACIHFHCVVISASFFKNLI